LAGKRILVTGASSGIGWHLALKLATRGAHVLATARRAEKLQSLIGEWDIRRKTNPQLAGSLTVSVGDLTLDEHRAKLVRLCKKEWDGLDILVNNAGAGAIGPFADATPERLRRVMEIDFFAGVELTRLAIPILQTGNSPAIVIVGSVLGHCAVPNKSEYCAAKFAIRGWSESLRCELAKDKIDVIMISPSTTRSEFFESLIGSGDEAISKSIGSMSPEQVALDTIWAIEKGKREVILSLGGKLLVWLSKWMPRTLDRILIKHS
jgi:short-subunit dehydrogenase